MPETDGDVFDLRDDGTVVIGWDGVRATLRRVKGAEWLAFEEEAEAASAWHKNLTPGEPPPAEPPPLRPLRELMGPEGRWLTLYQKVVAQLGGVEADRDGMPLWLADATVWNELSVWWRTSPLHRPAVGAALTPSR